MDTSMTIAVASAVIAAIACFAAYWQAHLMREHNRLSVLPHLSIITFMKESPAEFEATIQNQGVGPAIIEDFTVIYDGKKAPQFNAADWMPILDLVGIVGSARGLSLDSGEFIAPGKEYTLVDIKTENMPLSKLKDSLRRVEVIIKYKSVYGQVFTARMKWKGGILDLVGH